MNTRINIAGLQVSKVLYDLVLNEIAPGTGLSASDFWHRFSKIVTDLGPRNRELLVKRDCIQTSIDDYHDQRRGQLINMDEYQAFLTDIGYLIPEGGTFQISTKNVDKEISRVAGPQLVVPVNNARFALNAANARWGSLYDALYGTDAIDDRSSTGPVFNAEHAAKVIRWSTVFLDQAVPLSKGSHADVTEYSLKKSATGKQLLALLTNGDKAQLADTTQFAGYRDSDAEQVLLLINNGLHIELQIDRSHYIGEISAAGVKDVILESALSTIMDCEDSVTAVDAEDKTEVYRNWLGLMNGNLKESFVKNGETLQRVLATNRDYSDPAGLPFSLPGRSLLLVRNVGHLMTTDAVLDVDDNEIPEGMLDAMVTAFCALHDLASEGEIRNSRHGSIYIVKPKMHGPEEVAFADELFSRVEQALELDENSIKVGVMDEERRTSANLKESIRAVKDRLFFINTGFLDRTGDEIHTSMVAGPVFTKDVIKAQSWITAYEDRNMDTGLACGLPGIAQIGKGMWAMPDEMKQMLEVKRIHPEVGANCAWVPSPTAATLHATHYHQVNVGQRQVELIHRQATDLKQLLTPPLLNNERLTPEQIQMELDSSAQSILGYVVRWVEQGIGCSKVPDMNNVGLMEDRATLRISSQLLANWLFHGICTDDQVLDTFKRMAVMVDTQNAGDQAYINMAHDFDSSIAFQAACDLVFKGCEQPNGYTEPLLHQRRREFKAAQVS